MSFSHPISKAPVDRTFFVAVTILCLVAVAQLIAVCVALLPRFEFEKWARAMAPRTVEQPAEHNDALAVERMNAANALLAEGEKFRESRNFSSALEALCEADRLVPNKPGILIQMASDYMMLGKKSEAIAVLKKIVALPTNVDSPDAAFVRQAKSALTQLGANEDLSNSTPMPLAQESSELRDDIGIPVGSVLGIVDTKFVNGDPGQKNLRISIKAASGQTIDPMKVSATVDFYEQDDQAQIHHNTQPRPFEWMSGNVDWAEGLPETVQVKYRLPLEDRGDLEPLQYYGYVIAIYYNGELQDQRADPPSLLKDYAPPLHKDLSSPAPSE